MSADAPLVFDRRLLRRRRDRAAATLPAHDFLFRHTADALGERLDDVTRRFPLALDLGCHGGEVAAALADRSGIETLIQCDLSPAMARRAAANGRPALAADEELLPIAEASLDLVVSNLSLHWVNDLPGALVQIRRALKPDGLFLAALLGAGTLAELRVALTEAELAVSGGASPRLSPFADLRDAAGLLQRAGFALPVADAEPVTVTYDDAFRLFADLRGMGETNAVAARNPAPPPRALWPEAARLYAERHAEADGRIAATFQVIHLAGWAPHDAQAKPLRPGSAAARLADALEAEERSAGDKASPR
ncbi:MAG: methyltransferase domain-containing protein [Inquilinus sp.]|nr:methyltransferase domain-containing protein [Inquilinus sp.]